MLFNGIVIYSTQLHLISKSHFHMKIIKMSKLCIFWDSACEVIQSEWKLILSRVKLNFICNLEWSLISFVTTICKHFIDIVICSTQLHLIFKSHFSHWKSKNCRFSIIIQFFKIFLISCTDSACKVIQSEWISLPNAHLSVGGLFTS